MEETLPSKQRHGCITAYLIFMIIANSSVALMYSVGGEFFAKNSEYSLTPTVRIILSVIGVMNLIFAVYLFKWKKWAFYGFVLTSIATFIINLVIGMGIFSSVFGLIGIAILYGVLQMKQNGRSAWENLE